MHFDEAIFAELVRITIGDQPVSLVNVHLVAVPPDDPALVAAWTDLRARGDVGEASYREALDARHRGLARQDGEMRRLAREISKLPATIPLIVGGDFNTPPDEPGLRTFMRATGLHDTWGDLDDEPFVGGPPRYSWDATRNANARVSADGFDQARERLTAYERLGALANSFPRRIDFVFLGSQFRSEDTGHGRIVLVADIFLDHALQDAPREPVRLVRSERKVLDPFPLANYDSDTGFGYGAELFLLNTKGVNESLDLTFFRSTKGERWYRFVLSWPDLELRQGKIYPLAMDLVADYDKYINASFFGIGSGALYADRETYTREPLDVSLTLSRGSSPRVVGQAGVRSKTVRNSRFAEESRLRDLPPARNAGRVTYLSVLSNWRWDSRDSYINPSRGLVLQGEVEGTLPSMGARSSKGGCSPVGARPPQGGRRAALGNVNFVRTALWVQHYAVVCYPRTVLAVRGGLQRVFGDRLPVQVLLPLGGNGSLRGSSQDRFLGQATAIVNAELRLPIAGRLGGVLGWDAGKAWANPSSVDLRGWTANPTVGLRLSLRTFVVRCDVGFGKETTGLYLNFGQLF